jgi:DNA-binding transcriptional MerR regulator
MYSDEDISRLQIIKHLVDDEGLNLAGIGLVLRLRDILLHMKDETISARIHYQMEERLTSLVDEMLEMLGGYKR